MRLLIYLLALVSGFSAADAARAEVASASTISQTAVAAAEALALDEQQAMVLPASSFAHDDAVTVITDTPLAIRAATPVIRHDIAHE